MLQLVLKWAEGDGPTIPDPVPTLATYAWSWLDARLTTSGEPLRPRVRELYAHQLERHILPVLGDLKCSDVRTPVVRSWHTQLRGASGPGRSTAAKCYRLLSSIMATAVQDGFAKTNPCTIRGAGVEPLSKRPVPTVEEVLKLADLIDPHLRVMVLVAAFIGLRKGELLGLRRMDIDLERREISVLRQRQVDRHNNQLIGPPKSYAGVRVVALPESLVAELATHLDRYAQLGDYGLVFTGVKGGPLAPHVLQDRWSAAREELDLSHVHFHDLRHCAGTLAASTGAATKELMHRLGHSTPAASLIYQHATKPRDVALAAALDELISPTSDAPA